MNTISGYSEAKFPRRKAGGVLPAQQPIRYVPYSLNLNLPSEPKLQVITSWLETAKVPVPSKKTIIVHDGKIVPHTKSRKIFVQFEPEIIYGMRKFLLENGHKFDHILTFDAEVLRRFPHARFYVCANSWVPYEDAFSVDVSKKDFILTGLFTHMTFGEGHKYRHVIYNRQTEIRVPRLFYRSCLRSDVREVDNNPVFPSSSSKIELFKTAQFSLVIENSKQEHYFTEKIIDCLMTKTIPVYWGCPNIHHYFDTTGWIVLTGTTFEEFQQKVSVLTPDYYSQYTKVIEENFGRAVWFSNYYENLRRGLLSIPGY